MKKFHVVNLGCKVNRVESDDFAATLISQGASPVSVSDADLIIVNTCAVTGEAEKKTRKAIRQALRANASARVIVTGCAAALDADRYLSMDDRVQVTPKLAMPALLSEMASKHPESQDASTSSTLASAEGQSFAPSIASSEQNISDDNCGIPSVEPMRVGDGFPTRVGIKVQDGCNNACTFCVVHVARGSAWSRPSSQVISEAVRISLQGTKEIVLTGINLGSYSFEGLSLAGLLRCLLEATDDVRFRISSIEPCDVDDDLIELMATSDGRICRHLHLPLQSGSSKVLQEMARPYCADEYRALVEKLYAALPQLSLSTDVIVGFPGESEEDYLATESLVRACRFSKMHIFRYSLREGTPAAKRADQVTPELKAERAKRLEALEKELAFADLARRAGTREFAIVETGGVATTESYHTVAAPCGACVGDLVEVVL